MPTRQPRRRRPTPDHPGLRRTVVLDADGLSKLASRDRVVRAMLEQERDADSILVVPLIVTTQALAGGAPEDDVRTILRAAREAPGIDFDRCARAARLIQNSGLPDVVDALVAAEALGRAPSIVITSDRDDIRRLVDTDPDGKRVAIWLV